MRQPVHRPFSDGSMSVDTDFLASLTQSHQPLSIPSPFSVPQSLPEHYPSFSPGFHPATLFNDFRLGHDNPEPPINFISSSLPDQRSRSQSSTRNGVKPPRARSGRKMSFNDTRPSVGPISRGRSRPSMDHQRTMSQSDVGFGRMDLGIGLDTHREDQADPEFGNGAFTALPRGMDLGSWASVPSLVPGSIGSYLQEEVMDSPDTPAHPLASLQPGDTYKKQRRRECHNQVEKRRREHINTKIEELSQLLPPSYAQLDEGIDDDEEVKDPTSPIQKKKGKRSASKPKDAVQCKGRILTHSVNYIQ
jgi:hypothetical protein